MTDIVKQKEPKIELLFDAIRDPYDIANMLQLALALNAILYFTGQSISLDNKKIKGKIRSWGSPRLPKVVQNPSYEKQIEELKNGGKYLIGTSPHATENFLDVDVRDVKPVIVFGTETTGLIDRKQKCLDKVVKMPMSSNLRFMTLSVVAPPIAYEVYRQLRLKGKERE